MNTGMTMVPTVLSSALRIARPTAWTMSTSDAAGVDEGHAVERRHVDPFGEAAGVGQQAALAVVESAQVLEPDVALAGGHLTGGVAGPQRALRALAGRHPLR